MNPEELKKAWGKFTEKNEFILNPDEKYVDGIIDGVLKNEEKHGLKLCPCRLRDETKEKDLELICPCNFEIQKNWDKKGDCWCGLFVKRK